MIIKSIKNIALSLNKLNSEGTTQEVKKLNKEIKKLIKLDGAQTIINILLGNGTEQEKMEQLSQQEVSPISEITEQDLQSWALFHDITFITKILEALPKPTGAMSLRNNFAQLLFYLKGFLVKDTKAPMPELEEVDRNFIVEVFKKVGGFIYRDEVSVCNGQPLYKFNRSGPAIAQAALEGLPGLSPAGEQVLDIVLNRLTSEQLNQEIVIEAAKKHHSFLGAYFSWITEQFSPEEQENIIVAAIKANPREIMYAEGYKQNPQFCQDLVSKVPKAFAHIDKKEIGKMDKGKRLQDIALAAFKSNERVDNLFLLQNVIKIKTGKRYDEWNKKARELAFYAGLNDITRERLKNALNNNDSSIEDVVKSFVNQNMVSLFHQIVGSEFISDHKDYLGILGLSQIDNSLNQSRSDFLSDEAAAAKVLFSLSRQEGHPERSLVFSGSNSGARRGGYKRGRPACNSEDCKVDRDSRLPKRGQYPGRTNIVG